MVSPRTPVLDRMDLARAATMAAALLLHTGPLGAQDALVLSGGGSRGIAHAGVIMGLEQRGFRPELVVGASIGAIIGGLYAAGVPPDSIWSLTRQQDWQELFSMRPASVGPVWDGRRPVFELGFRVDRSKYVDGLVADWRVNRLLTRLFFDAGARARGDFDALPRRYRSVAADLRTGEVAVLGRGDLARAVRASMAVPGVFAPVMWDGAPLTDGGLADYLPVGPARDAGANRVVAVDVLRPPVGDVNLNPFQVALRSFRYTLYNARREDDAPDVAIQPDVSPYLFAAVFLREPAPLLEAGLRAGLDVSVDLTGGRGARPPREPPAALGELRFESNDSSLEPLVRAAFANAVRGRYDVAAVLTATDRLYATGLFDGVWPHVESVEAGDTLPDLVVRADALPPQTLAGAAGYDADRGFRGWAALTRRFSGPGRLVLAASAGAIETWASLSIRTPLTFARPALGVDAGVSHAAYDVRRFADGEIDGEHEVRRTGGWAGVAWRGVEPDLEVRATVRAERVDDGALEGLAWGPVLRLEADRRHARIVGTPTTLEADFRFGDIRYRRYRAAGAAALLRRRFAAALLADVTATNGSAPEDVMPALGDDVMMPGLRWGGDRGRTRAVGGIDFAVAVPFEAYARIRLRTGAVADRFEALDEVRWLGGVETGLLLWTPAGRFAVDVGVNTRGEWRIGLDIGPGF